MQSESSKAPTTHPTASLYLFSRCSFCKEGDRKCRRQQFRPSENSYRSELLAWSDAISFLSFSA